MTKIQKFKHPEKHKKATLLEGMKYDEERGDSTLAGRENIAKFHAS